MGWPGSRNENLGPPKNDNYRPFAFCRRNLTKRENDREITPRLSRSTLQSKVCKEHLRILSGHQPASSGHPSSARCSKGTTAPLLGIFGSFIILSLAIVVFLRNYTALRNCNFFQVRMAVRCQGHANVHDAICMLSVRSEVATQFGSVILKHLVQN